MGFGNCREGKKWREESQNWKEISNLNRKRNENSTPAAAGEFEVCVLASDEKSRFGVVRDEKKKGNEIRTGARLFLSSQNIHTTHGGQFSILFIHSGWHWESGGRRWWRGAGRKAYCNLGETQPTKTLPSRFCWNRSDWESVLYLKTSSGLVIILQNPSHW